jgi:hypothetical protein
MTLAEAGSWAGNMAELNILYPGHGLEGLMTIALIVIWIGWHIWQIRMEESNYADDLNTLKQGDNMAKALKGERVLRSL